MTVLPKLVATEPRLDFLARGFGCSEDPESSSASLSPQIEVKEKCLQATLAFQVDATTPKAEASCLWAFTDAQ